MGIASPAGAPGSVAMKSRDGLLNVVIINLDRCTSLPYFQDGVDYSRGVSVLRTIRI